MTEKKSINIDDILGISEIDRVMKRLTQHALGEVLMTPTEVTAAKAVLGKKLPDVKAVEVSGEIKHVGLVDILAGLGPRNNP